MRLASWNVNSLRQRLDHLARFVAEYRPDVLCLQETKVEDEIFPTRELADLGFPHQAVSGQKSYNGVAVLSREAFASGSSRHWCRKDDKRHLCVVLASGLELHNFYVPSGGPLPDPESNPRFAHKLAFLDEMAVWARGQDPGRRLLLVGDLNVAPLQTDVWNHKKQLRNVGHTPVESERIARILKAGRFSDVGRRFVPPEEPLYTWWGYRFPTAFERDYGWRLDHAFASQACLPEIRDFAVVRETRGWERPSDHVPLLLELA